MCIIENRQKVSLMVPDPDGNPFYIYNIYSGHCGHEASDSSRMGHMCTSDLSMSVQRGHHRHIGQPSSLTRPLSQSRPLLRGQCHNLASRSRSHLAACCCLADRPHLQLATAKLPKYLPLPRLLIRTWNFWPVTCLLEVRSWSQAPCQRACMMAQGHQQGPLQLAAVPMGLHANICIQEHAIRPALQDQPAADWL